MHLPDLAAAGPRQTADFIKSRPRKRLLGTGKRDDGFGVDRPGEAAGFPIRHQISVFRRLLARIPGLVADLDAAQPLDADIAFPARHHQAQRIALLGAQRLAVLRIDHEAVVETFFQRQAAVHVRAVGALDQHPLRVFLEPDLLQQRRQLHPGPFRAADHAVRELQRIEPVSYTHLDVYKRQGRGSTQLKLSWFGIFTLGRLSLSATKSSGTMSLRFRIYAVSA